MTGDQNREWYEREVVFPAEFQVFENQNRDLLHLLSSDRDPHYGPLDEGKTWRELKLIARHHFWAKKAQADTLSPAERVKRLTALQKALKEAREILNRAMHDQVGDLLAGLYDKSDNDIRMLMGESRLFPLNEIDAINNTAKRLAALEAAARRAAARLPETGRPYGSAVLAWEQIYALAKVYREATSREITLSNNLFERFVERFRIAVDVRACVTKNMIENARTKVNNDPRLRLHSPFEQRPSRRI